MVIALAGKCFCWLCLMFFLVIIHAALLDGDETVVVDFSFGIGYGDKGRYNHLCIG